MHGQAGRGHSWGSSSKIAGTGIETWTRVHLMLGFLLFAIGLPSQGTLPYRLVATNNPAAATSGDLPRARTNCVPQPSGFRLRLYQAWWNVSDYVRYGVPYLVNHDRIRAGGSAVLFCVLGVVLFRAGLRRHNHPPVGLAASSAINDLEHAETGMALSQGRRG